MNLCRNVTFSGGLPSEHEPEQLFSSSCTTLASLDDLFSANSTMQEGDINSEWLSIFVEDCLSTSASSILPVVVENVQDKSSIVQEPAAAAASKPIHTSCSGVLDSKFEVAGKARGKRSPRPTRKNPRKCIGWSQQGSPDPPLLQQAYWLADSELILPKQEEVDMIAIKGLNVQQQQPRRCSHCLSQKTPQWRAGPLGPKTLCNACGVRYKSGRLLPEYRPAKSPTFVSYKHSNSHKKVLEMRTMFNG